MLCDGPSENERRSGPGTFEQVQSVTSRAQLTMHEVVRVVGVVVDAQIVHGLVMKLDPIVQ